MTNLLRSAFYAFVASMVFIAYHMDPETAQLKDFLRLLHAPLFWRLDLALTVAFSCLQGIGSAVGLPFVSSATLTSANANPILTGAKRETI